MKNETRMAIQRTLILTLGEQGTAVAQHLEQMLAEWRAPSVVAVRQLDPDGEVSVATEITEALHEISRLAHRSTLGELGYGPDRLDELVVWVVGGPEAPLNETAVLAEEQALALLGIDPFTLGLVLVNDRTDGVSDEGFSKPSHHTAFTERSCLSLFYLAEPVNEAGLTLDGDVALYEQAARFLVLHTCTPLRDTPVWVEQAYGWGNGLGIVSFGLTWLAWPGDVAQARAARWLAEAIVRQTLGEASRALGCNALLREAELAPSLLVVRLTPSAVAETARLATGDVPLLAPWALLRPAGDVALTTGAEHLLLASMGTMVEGWNRVLDDSAPAWERMMTAGIKDVIAHVRDWVTQGVNVGGLGGARALVGGLDQRFSEWVTGVEQRMEQAREDLERIERDAQAVQTALSLVLDKMPRRHWRELLRLLHSPSRWVWLLGYWRKVQKLYARSVLLNAAALEARITIEQMKRACGIYWAAGAELESISRELDGLECRVCDLFDAVAGASAELPAWPRMPLLLGDDADALLARLAERHLPVPREQAREFLAQWGPLSRWWVEGVPDRGTAERWLAEQVSPIADVSIWDVVRCRHAEPRAVQRWMEELTAQTSPLWRWDPAALSEDERARLGGATVLIGPADGDIPWNEGKMGLRTMWVDRADRMAVVVLRWGIPGGIRNEE